MKNIIYLIILSLSFSGFLGCKKQEAAKTMPNMPEPVNQSQALSSEAADFIPDSGSYGTVTQCPVSGDKVVVGKDTAGIQYKDKKYYMCCPACIGQFKANPDKYIQK